MRVTSLSKLNKQLRANFASIIRKENPIPQNNKKNTIILIHIM
jgi:hypothetical protein